MEEVKLNYAIPGVPHRCAKLKSLAHECITRGSYDLYDVLIQLEACYTKPVLGMEQLMEEGVDYDTLVNIFIRFLKETESNRL